jgi:hypothetical protein
VGHLLYIYIYLSFTSLVLIKITVLLGTDGSDCAFIG